MRKKKTATKPECHPNRAHYAKGLCASCYHAQAKKRKTKQHKEPVVVTHTHEVIRQVQQPEEKPMAATHENDKPKAAKEEAPKAVTSPAGTTEPTMELGGDGVTPKAEWDEKYKALKKQQDEHDEKRRQQARDDAGPMLTTEKHKSG